MWFQKFDDKLFTNLVVPITSVYPVKFFSINLLPSFTTSARSFWYGDMTRSLIRPIDFFPVLQARTQWSVDQLQLYQNYYLNLFKEWLCKCLTYNFCLYSISGTYMTLLERLVISRIPWRRITTSHYHKQVHQTVKATDDYCADQPPSTGIAVPVLKT